MTMERDYHPQPIIIPENLPHKRSIRDNIDFLTGGPLNDTSNYDFKTLFYDVFFGANSNTIYAVGPPWINLSKDLSFKIYYKDEALIYRLVDFPQSSVLTIDKQINEKDVELTFDFNLFTKVIRIQKEEFPRTDFAVVACQKNNRIKWIKRWCEWYKKLYGADIFLYDNGSDNFSEIAKSLIEFNPTIIKWDFKFGPYNTFHNLFCQVGAYNHFRLKYNFKYGMVFDIDEYLITNTELSSFLEPFKDVALFGLDNYYIPNVREKEEDFGIEDFHFRPKHLRNRGFKYIFLREKMEYLDIHYAIPKEGKSLLVPPHIMYFNHYKGLSTYWKPWDERDQLEYLSEELVPDIEAKKQFEKL